MELKALSNLIHRKFDQSKTKLSTNLTGMQSWIVGYLYVNLDKDIFQRDIEAEFSVRRSTVTGILNLMEKHDLIIRKSVENDARLKKIILTNKAIAIQETIINDIEKFEEHITKGITKEELNTLYHILDKIRLNIEN